MASSTGSIFWLDTSAGVIILSGILAFVLRLRPSGQSASMHVSLRRSTKEASTHDVFRRVEGWSPAGLPKKQSGFFSEGWVYTQLDCAEAAGSEIPGQLDCAEAAGLRQAPRFFLALWG